MSYAIQDSRSPAYLLATNHTNQMNQPRISLNMTGGYIISEGSLTDDAEAYRYMYAMQISFSQAVTDPSNATIAMEKHVTNRRNLYKRTHELQLIAIRKAPLWKNFLFRLSKVRRETYFFFSLITLCLLGSGGGLVVFTGMVPQAKHKCEAMKVIAGWLADMLEVLGYTASLYFGIFAGVWLWFLGLIMRALFKSGRYCRQSYGIAPMIVDIVGEGGLAWLRLHMLLLACMWYKRSAFLDGDLSESKLTPAEIQAVNSIFMYLPPLSPPKEGV